MRTKLIQNDHIFISHYHDPADGFTNLEDDTGWISDDQVSTSSVVRKSFVKTPKERIQDRGIVDEVSQAFRSFEGLYLTTCTGNCASPAPE